MRPTGRVKPHPWTWAGSKKTTMSNLCGKPMPKAKNGAERGTCTIPREISHSRHGNGTCCNCGNVLTSENSSPSLTSKGRKSGRCRPCNTTYERDRQGYTSENYQHPGQKHTFSTCGCTGILPVRKDCSNEFAVRMKTKRGGFGCRVTQILNGSQACARRGGYKPVPRNTPHSVIRAMMANPYCERCGEVLRWSVILGCRAPHLHHDHETGEPLGFTHPVCNPPAMAREIERLKGLLRKSA
jgi:hypothetical protein